MAMAHDDVHIDGHKVIRTYSTNDEMDYINDDRNRRFYLDPGNEFNFDYGKAFAEGYTAREGVPHLVAGRYAWMRDHRQVLIDNGILDKAQSRLNVDFVSRRGVLTRILQMGGRKDWDIGIAVTLYKGTYHLSSTMKNRAAPQKKNLIAASTNLLVKFVTSRDGLTPDEPAPVNVKEIFFTLMTVNCGNHRLLVRSEIQAEKRIAPDEPPQALPNPRYCMNVRSRPLRHTLDP
ncbi:decapping and exoribonuclease protein-like [Strongylocentrotus purpuratus]|uniref:Decapping nuclease n=1 Tax=Strongylocentrotus purpuratus TaxID=7668 RepID=A0A7M7NWT9_STRPU|nr:decapping and exoribonuclease protein-like [Strongylocentrotus purpuratus]